MSAFMVTAGFTREDGRALQGSGDDHSAIMESLADRLAEASPSACTNACARSTGPMSRAAASVADLMRKISRHPPGALSSVAARSQREGDPVRAARSVKA
jgi:hypothetical protein